jgi:purine nucleosidase
MTTNRRRFVLGAAAALSALSTTPVLAKIAKPFTPAVGPRSRVLFVNDLSGDIDGLFAAVHAIFSNSIDLRAIIGTTTGRPGETAQASVDLAEEILKMTGQSGRIKVFPGSEKKLSAPDRPDQSRGANAIIAEAMRTDTNLPLYVAVGGGLTEVASALMIEPAIAGRFTLVWIGGDAYPAGGIGETNFGIDPLAAQFVFNETSVAIWQIPRSVYAACVVSNTEIQAYVAPHGRIGQWLYRQVVDAPAKYMNRLNMGETWTLGDNPLVLLTALGDWGPSEYRPAFKFERTGSSLHDDVVAPRLLPDGRFEPRSEGRKIRVYRSIDNRLMLGDMFAKIQMNAGS